MLIFGHADMKKNEIIYKIITHPLFVFPLFFIMLMASNGSVPLVDEDESAYALIASQMMESGDYIEQTKEWVFIHRKPPLHMWLMTGSMKVFGNNEFGVRFMTALFSWGTLLLIYVYGRALYYERIAMSAAIICGTCFLFPIYGKIAFTDGLLLFFQTWAAFSLMAIMQWKKIIHIAMFWVAFSLGVLVKGPPIILFTGIFSFLIILLHADRRRIFRLRPWFFLPLALAPLLYWGYLYWQVDNGETIKWMINWYVTKRGEGDVVIENQTGYPGYYLFMFAFVFIPYFRYFPPALWEGMKSLFLRRKHPEFLMLAMWLVSGWWIYEFIPSKLPSYALASLPAIAILMAHEMVSLSEHKVFSRGLKVMSVLEIFLTIGLVVMAYLFGRDYLDDDILKLVIGTMMFLPFASIMSFVQQLRKRFNLSIYFHLIFVGVFWLLLSIVVYPKTGQYWSGSVMVAESINQNVADNVDTIYVDNQIGQLPSIPYYINQMDDKDFNLVYTWWDAYQMYLKEEPFVGVMTPASRDTIDIFVEMENEVINSYRLDRGDYKAEYYLIMNDAARK